MSKSGLSNIQPSGTSKSLSGDDSQNQLGSIKDGKSRAFNFWPFIDFKDESGDIENYSYKEVSDMSEITQESFPDGYIVPHAGGAVEDLVDFDKLV